MSNVFKKLISKELGEMNYNRYFAIVKKNVEDRSPDSQALYNDIYEKLKSRDIKSIAKMYNRLNDTMLLAFRISRHYIFAFLFYLATSFFLIIKSTNPVVAIIALSLISICLIYKTYEFIANKFCYIDARIVLIYKTVLDRILLNEKGSTLMK